MQWKDEFKDRLHELLKMYLSDGEPLLQDKAVKAVEVYLDEILSSHSDLFRILKRHHNKGLQLSDMEFLVMEVAGEINQKYSDPTVPKIIQS